MRGPAYSGRPGRISHERPGARGNPAKLDRPIAACPGQSRGGQGRAGIEAAQDRFNLKFATIQDLTAAQNNAKTARLQLQSLEQIGVETERQVTSPATGVVGNVNVHDGQIVTAGAPVVELVARNEIEVKLGVEPEDILLLKPDQTVLFIPVNADAAQSFKGRVRLITQRVNPDTRLVDVYASVDTGTELLLDDYLRAQIETAAHEGMVVPRTAVLPRDGKGVLFTVNNSRAVEHMVQLGVESGNVVEIVSAELKPGEWVVTQGNYELTNGLPVEIAKQP
jgi:RND family efflux transporter MFP subunit